MTSDDSTRATPTKSGPGRSSGTVVRKGDKVFAGLATGSGAFILAILAGVAIFLIIKAMPAITADQSKIAAEDGKTGLIHYIAPLVFGTVLAAAIALAVALPMAIAVALFINFYAPRRVAQTLSYVVDLLAAIPSVVYGLWGIAVFGLALRGTFEWLADHVGWLPFFEGPASVTGRTMLTVSLVLAVMILPIITAVIREVFSQTPRQQREAALALGATRWEMIRMTVFPFGRSAIVSSAMLGLGRALGETMAVAIILSGSGIVTFNLISSGNPSTIAANIASSFPESSGLDINVLIASGLVLFAITLVVNMAARAIIGKRQAIA